jgi:intein/homing endonuclease
MQGFSIKDALNSPDNFNDDLSVQKVVQHAYSGKDTDWDEIQKQLIKHSCAFFAQEFLTGPPEPPFHGRYMVAKHHEAWDDLVMQHDRLCVLASRDHGKCQTGDALIQRADGALVRLDQWEGGNVLALDTDTHNLVSTYAGKSRKNGKKKTLRITTRTGRVVTVTLNHPLRTFFEWVRADKLAVGDKIAVPSRLENLGKKAVLDAWLLGLLLGDGGLTGSNVILSTQDTAILQKIKRAGIRYRYAGQYDYRLPGLQKRMREVGFWKKTCHEKRVPDIIFEAADKDIGRFIAGYLDADGSISIHGGGAVEFYSVSKKVLHDVQSLLIRLGVTAVLSRKKGTYKGEAHQSWRLTVRGKDILVLAEQVSPEGVKQEQLKELVRLQEQKAVSSGNAVDLFPKEAWDLIKNIPYWFTKKRYPRFRKECKPTREKLQSMAALEDNSELLAMTQAPILWDEIVSIEDSGIQETWSLCVPEHANYVANDIVNHNTFFFDFAYPLWKIVTQPGGRGYIFSNTEEQAIRILDDIKSEIESNPKLQHLMPPRKDRKRWSAKSIRTTNNHRIYARGFLTKIRGAHPTWIVVDDGLGDETMYSEIIREKQIDYFYSAITNMIVPGGQIIVVGTPFHQADLYSSLKNNKQYYYQAFPAFDEQGNPLWPERYDKARLKAREEEIGTVRFTREFKCKPVSDDMSLFPTYLFKGEPTEQLAMTLGMDKEFLDELGLTVYMGVDFAMSSSVNADNTVIFVMGLDSHGNRWVIDIALGKGLAYQAQLSKINDMARKYEPALIFLESNQMQRIFGDELIRTTDLPIKQFTTGVQKNSLDKGVPSLRTLLENGKFRIPRGDQRSIELTDKWISEMQCFTWHKGKLQGVGTHDDLVMACWICDQAIRSGGFSFDFGEDYDTTKEMKHDEYDTETEKSDSALTDSFGYDKRIEDELNDDLYYDDADAEEEALNMRVPSKYSTIGQWL